VGVKVGGERRDMLAKSKHLTIDSRGHLLFAIPLVDARVLKATAGLLAVVGKREADAGVALSDRPSAAIGKLTRETSVPILETHRGNSAHGLVTSEPNHIPDPAIACAPHPD
jgi:hypothetical protein